VLASLSGLIRGSTERIFNLSNEAVKYCRFGYCSLRIYPRRFRKYRVTLMLIKLLLEA
jgi:hypothetical protein